MGVGVSFKSRDQSRLSHTARSELSCSEQKKNALKARVSRTYYQNQVLFGTSGTGI